MLPELASDLRGGDGEPSEVPDWMRVPYVPHGYRLGFSATELLLSFLTWHNETVNIWSHVAPGVRPRVRRFIRAWKSTSVSSVVMTAALIAASP